MSKEPSLRELVASINRERRESSRDATRKQSEAKEAAQQAQRKHLAEMNERADRFIASLPRIVEEMARNQMVSKSTFPIDQKDLTKTPQDFWFGEGLDPACLPTYAQKVWDACAEAGLRPVLKDGSWKTPAYSGGGSWYGLRIWIHLESGGPPSDTARTFDPDFFWPPLGCAVFLGFVILLMVWSGERPDVTIGLFVAFLVCSLFAYWNRP